VSSAISSQVEECLASISMRLSLIFRTTRTIEASSATLRNHRAFRQILDSLAINFTVNHAILVAGGALSEEVEATSPLNVSANVIQKSINLNLVSQLLLIQELAPILARAQPLNKSVTLVSSLNAKGDFGYPAYSAAKAGLSGIANSLAAPLGKDGIRINAVQFGTVVTARSLELHGNNATHYQRLQELAIVAGRFVTAKEAAQVLYCLSIELTPITGSSIEAANGQGLPGNHYR
jgi:NAD(P)-dependent dehydrogenase (short-subunit alcohol dehydrogenase family)